jgi:hypothetical protein
VPSPTALRQQSTIDHLKFMDPSSIIVTHTINSDCAVNNPNEIFMVTRGMLRERAVELAVTNGRQPHEVSKFDWEEAKRELIPIGKF